MKVNLHLVLTLLCIVTTTFLSAQVAINSDGTNPDPSAMLDVKSTAKGVLLPRVADVADVTNPATGLIVFQTKDNNFYFFDENLATNGAWVRLVAEGPMGVVLNGMLDVHGSIKNTSDNNDGTVLIEDDARLAGFFDVFGGIRNSSGAMEVMYSLMTNKVYR